MIPKKYEEDEITSMMFFPRPTLHIKNNPFERVIYVE